MWIGSDIQQQMAQGVEAVREEGVGVLRDLMPLVSEWRFWAVVIPALAVFFAYIILKRRK